jgi:hypothetical protein
MLCLRLRRTLAVVVLTGGFVLATPASGGVSGTGWLPPVAEVGPYESYSFSVGVAPTGDAVVAAVDVDGISTTSKPPGGSWSEPLSIGYSLTFPTVAFDDAGNAVLTALQIPGTPGVARAVAYARDAGDETWAGPTRLSNADDDAFVPPALALNRTGQAVAAWVGSEGDLLVLRVSLRSTDGTWSPAENIGYAGSLGNRPPSVAIDNGGDVVVVWTRGPENAGDVYAELHPAGGGWQPAQVLSSRGDTRLEWKVVMNGRGDAVAVWAELDQPEQATLYSARLAAGTTTWSKPTPIPVSDGFDAAGAYIFFGGALSVAIDPAGTATLVAPTKQLHVEAVTLPGRSETWEGPVVIGDGGTGNYQHEARCLIPQVRLDGHGGAVAVWGGAGLFAARRQPGSQTWDPPVQVAAAPTCFGRDLAVDASGDAVAIWNAGVNAGTEDLGRLDAAVLDATPPVLARLVVPTTARIRHRVRFSVAASDAWSKLARLPLWRFGDGVGARGLHVRHAYRRRGRYRVSVTAEDLAGNSATATGEVVVRRRELATS